MLRRRNVLTPIAPARPCSRIVFRQWGSRTSAGELIHHSPVAREAGRTVPVPARFVQVAPDEVRFELGAHEASHELIIR
jgi:hypothetical protein